MEGQKHGNEEKQLGPKRFNWFQQKYLQQLNIYLKIFIFSIQKLNIRIDLFGIYFYWRIRFKF